MSSYLNIYVVPKEESTKPMRLTCFSRSHGLYHAIGDTITVPYAEGCEAYIDLTEENMLAILQDISNDISTAEKQLVEYEKYATHNTDLITDIIGLKEYIEDLIRSQHYLELIQALVFNTTHGFTSFKKVCCNID